jgi:hypothetical protein
MRRGRCERRGAISLSGVHKFVDCIVEVLEQGLDILEVIWHQSAIAKAMPMIVCHWASPAMDMHRMAVIEANQTSIIRIEQSEAVFQSRWTLQADIDNPALYLEPTPICIFIN